MRLAAIDDSGRPVGFYESAAHAERVGLHDPSILVEITDDQWQECLTNPGARRLSINGGSVVIEPYSPLSSFTDVAAAKLREINAYCDAEVAALAAKYPDTEVLSWYRQEREARELQADPQASTPLIDNIAAQRGITREDLASRIITKADDYALEAGAAIGRRQALEDQIEAVAARFKAHEITEAQARAEVEALSYATAAAG